MDEYFKYVTLLIPGTLPATVDPVGVHPYRAYDGPGMGPYYNVRAYALPSSIGSVTVFNSTITKYYDHSLYVGDTTDTNIFQFANLAGSYIEEGAGTHFQWMDESMTMEGWFYTPTNSATRCLMTTGNSVSINKKWAVFVLTDGTIQLQIFNGSSTTPVESISSSSGAVSIGPSAAWYHVAVSRDISTNTFYLFLDGALVGSVVYDFGTNVITWGWGFGPSYLTTTTVRYPASYFTDVRVTKGICRYTNTTLPTGNQLFGTVSGAVTDENGDPVAAYVTAIPNLGTPVTTTGYSTTYPPSTGKSFVTPTTPLRTYTTISDGTTGAYSLFLAKAEWTLLFQKPDGTPLLNNIVHRVIAE